MSRITRKLKDRVIVWVMEENICCDEDSVDECTDDSDNGPHFPVVNL
jgi:hypothetical protein